MQKRSRYPVMMAPAMGAGGAERIVMALVLQAEGFENVRVMDGGITAWPYEKVA